MTALSVYATRMVDVPHHLQTLQKFSEHCGIFAAGSGWSDGDHTSWSTLFQALWHCVACQQKVVFGCQYYYCHETLTKLQERDVAFASEGTGHAVHAPLEDLCLRRSPPRGHQIQKSPMVLVGVSFCAARSIAHYRHVQRNAVGGLFKSRWNSAHLIVLRQRPRVHPSIRQRCTLLTVHLSTTSSFKAAVCVATKRRREALSTYYVKAIFSEND